MERWCADMSLTSRVATPREAMLGFLQGNDEGRDWKRRGEEDSVKNALAWSPRLADGVPGCDQVTPASSWLLALAFCSRD